MLMIVDDIADFVVREASLSGSELAMCGEMKFVDPHANPGNVPDCDSVRNVRKRGQNEGERDCNRNNRISIFKPYQHLAISYDL